METRSNLAFLHSKEILKIFSRIYLQFQGFCVWKLNETKRFTDLNEKWMILYMYKEEYQSEFRESMQTVDLTGKILPTFRGHDLSHARSGNSGGEKLYAWNLKMAQKYPSQVENQTTDVYFTFLTSLMIVFKVQLHGTLKKCKKKIDSNLTRATIKHQCPPEKLAPSLLSKHLTGTYNWVFNYFAEMSYEENKETCNRGETRMNQEKMDDGEGR